MCHQDLIIIEGNKIVNENLICGINKGILVDPINLNCGHTFCKECITLWLKVKKVCPLCMKDINYDLSDRSTNYPLKNIIDNLNIKCNQSPCEWTGKLGDLNNHNKECNHIQIKCKYEKCKFTGVRVDVNKHEQECEYQIIECNDCKLKMEKNMLNFHNEICLEKDFTCIHCQKVVKKIETLKHQKNCDYYITECPYKAFGCTGTFYKKDLQEHLKNNYYHYTIHNNLIHYCDFIISKDSSSLLYLNNKVIKLYLGISSNKKYCIFANLVTPKIKDKITINIELLLYDYIDGIYKNDSNIVEYSSQYLENSSGYAVVSFKDCEQFSDFEKKAHNYNYEGYIRGKIRINEI